MKRKQKQTLADTLNYTLEALQNLGAENGLEIQITHDDCTGLDYAQFVIKE